MFSTARWTLPRSRRVVAAAGPGRSLTAAAPPPSNPSTTAAASFSTSASSCVSVKAKRMEKRDKIARKRTTRELRREKEEKRDEALRQHDELRRADLQSKRTEGQEIQQAVPELSEDQLEAMYDSLMSATPQDLALPALSASNTPALPDPAASAESRQERITRLAERIRAFEDEQSGEASRSVDTVDGTPHSMGVMTSEGRPAPLSSTLVAETPSPARTILDQLENELVVRQVHGALPAIQETSPPSLAVPTGLLSRPDYEDLVLACAYEGDREGVIKGLDLMQRSVSIKEGNVIEEVLAAYAVAGRAQDALAVANYARQDQLPLSVTAHHHLLSTILPSHPELAIQHLRSMEASGHTPLLATYTAVTKQLLSPASPPHLVREGWDLFAHARLVAYPVPDVPLYSTMIQACAHGAHPSPERAIDLFIEMTDDNKLPPSELAYNGVIRACAREGSREFYYEALRYMRRMLDKNVAPSRHTFHALLEGARRHGDLARARWMLVKMIAVGGESTPNETTLALLLQTYAAYKPVAMSAVEEVRALKEIEAVKSSQSSPSTGDPVSEPSKRARPSPTLAEKDDPAQIVSRLATDPAKSGALRIVELLGEASLFYPGPMPQTSAEVVTEGRNLFLQVVDASILDAESPSTNASEPRTTLFPEVEPSTFLFNSYLAVLNSHAPFSAALDFVNNSFVRGGIAKNRFTYELAMRRCELARNKEAAVVAAKKVWEEWLLWSETPFPGNADAEDSGSLRKEAEEWIAERRNGRHVSKMWGGLIRVLAKSFREDEALQVLKQFRTRYPPAIVRRAILPSLNQAASDAREGASSPAAPNLPTLPVRIASPLYPETSPSLDPLRPPYLLFKDLRVLHQRLADVENKAGLAIVTGVARRYEVALAEARRSERRHEVSRR